VDLVNVTVNDDHLTVQVGKRTETKITVFENCLNAYLAIVYSRDERAGGRNLKDSVDGSFKVPSQGCGDDGRRTAPAARHLLFERSLQ
jgi:hypothetical protein